MARVARTFGAPLANFVATLAVFFAGAGRRALWPPDEPRYATVAREMNATGEYLVPHLNGAIYAEKPPLFFWMEAAAMRAWPGSDVAPRLPSLVLGAATVALLFALSRRLFGTAGGLAAAVVLATTFEFAFLSQRANIDASLTFFTTLAIAAFARGYLIEPARPGRWYALAYAATGLAVLVKGPAGALVPALVCGTTVVAREGPRGAARGHVAAGAALVLAIVAAWLLPAVLHAHALEKAAGAKPWTYAKHLLIEKAAGHGFGEQKNGPPWFYLERIWGDAAPWCAFWPLVVLAIARWRDARWREVERFGLAWTIPFFVVMSLIPAKRNLYLLPIFPGLAFLVGIAVAHLEEAPERARHLLFAVTHRLLLAAGALGGAGAIALWALVSTGHTAVLARMHGIEAALTPRLLGEAALLGGAAFAAAMWGLAGAARGRLGAALGGLAGVAIVATLGFSLVAFPILDREESVRPIASRVLALSDQAGGARIGLYRNQHEAWMFYLERTPLPLVKEGKLDAFLAADGGSPAIAIALEEGPAPAALPGVVLERVTWRGKKFSLLANEAAAERIRKLGP